MNHPPSRTHPIARIPWAVAWFVGALLAATACGGKVHLDTGSDGGTGKNPCPSWCKTWLDLGCPSGMPTQAECVAECESTLFNVGVCRDEVVAGYECAAAASSCEAPECDDARTAFMSCVAPAGPCETGECVVQGGLSCTTVCGGVPYEYLCEGSSSPTCTCKVDGEVVGTCPATPPKGVPFLGCCAKYFAESG
jgi:hypothetical protein